MATDKMDRGLDDIIADTVSRPRLPSQVTAIVTEFSQRGNSARGRRNGGPRRGGPHRDRHEGPRDGIRKVRQLLSPAHIGPYLTMLQV